MHGLINRTPFGSVRMAHGLNDASVLRHARRRQLQRPLAFLHQPRNHGGAEGGHLRLHRQGHQHRHRGSAHGHRLASLLPPAQRQPRPGPTAHPGPAARRGEQLRRRLPHRPDRPRSRHALRLLKPPPAPPLGQQFLDDCFVTLEKDPFGKAVAEIIDPRGPLRPPHHLSTSSEVSAYQVYAPVDKAFIVVEPQFNWGEPFSRIWGNNRTGMVMLRPGQSVTYSVQLELFKP